MTTYAIRFVFDVTDAKQPPLYAGEHKGAMGWAPTLKTARMFDSHDEARRWLDNGYGAASKYGHVVVVSEGMVK